MKLVFATNNQHKLLEIQKILGDSFQLFSLHDIKCTAELPEEQATIEGNASQKAFYVYNHFGYNCFADDTGLEIDSLGGEPGVFSARYAGETKDPESNMDKVLSGLSKINNRKARFKTVISLVINGKETLFEGIVNGTILHEKRGRGGFGYDPIFLPDGYSETFAEMDMDQKNEISHRGLAVKKLTDYLMKL